MVMVILGFVVREQRDAGHRPPVCGLSGSGFVKEIESGESGISTIRIFGHAQKKTANARNAEAVTNNVRLLINEH